jgi:hypothetical protein
MRGRVDHLLELARLAGKVLLSYAVAAWLLFLGLGVLLDEHLATGSPWILVAALLLATPAPLLLSRRSTTRRPERLEQAWAALDSRDATALAAFHDLLQQQTGLGRADRLAWEERLLEAWHDVEHGLNPATAADLRDLLFVQQRLGGRELDFLRALTPDLIPAADLLHLWNKALASGHAPDGPALEPVCRVLADGPAVRGLRPALPLLVRLWREDHAQGRALLRAQVAGGRIAPRRLPEDLRPLLAGEAPSRAGGPLARVPLVRLLPLSRWARLLKTRPRLLAGAGALAVVLAAAGLWLGREPAPSPMQAPPETSYAYAPPSGVEGGYTLQVLASRDSAQTAQFVAAMHGDGRYAYALAPRQNGSYYRVRLGWFEERSEADSVAALLKERHVITEWYVANFDREGRLFETLAPPDSTESRSSKEP